MKPEYRTLARWTLRGLIWLLWAPMALAINLVRMWAARELRSDSLHCSTCGTEISLLGLWECGTCSYRFYGFYFARCEVCGDLPAWIDCPSCGACTKNPALFL